MDHLTTDIERKKHTMTLFKRDIFFLIILLLAIIIQISISIAPKPALQEKGTISSQFNKAEKDSQFTSEEKDLKIQTAVGIFFILLIATGLSINFLALFFMITNRAGLKNFLFPSLKFYQKTFYSLKDILYHCLFLCQLQSSSQLLSKNRNRFS